MRIRVFLLFVGLSFLTSCGLENSDPRVRTEFMPVESVEIPEYFIQGDTYEILLSYVKPSSCYVFNNILFDIEGHQRTVSILNTVYVDDNCEPQNELTTVGFDLTVSGNDVYLFKFYQGKDEYGVDQYHLVEVPVVNSRETNAIENR